MPRLGDDPNMATAYPDRVNTNLRGSWMRQMLYTMLGTLVLYKVVFTDYKSATKDSMAKKGLSAEAQEKIVPKTAAEKRRDIEMAKRSHKQKMEFLQYEAGNLTNAVIELQQLAVEHYGVTLQHPLTLGEKEEGDEDAGEGEGGGTPQDGAGGDKGVDTPTVNLRGGESGKENPDADGGSGGKADAGGEGTRRLLTREKGEQEDQSGRAAGRDEPAALRGSSAGPRQQLKGSLRGQG